MAIQGVSSAVIAPPSAPAADDASGDTRVDLRHRGALHTQHAMPQHGINHTQIPHWVLTHQRAVPQLLLGMRSGKLVPTTGTLINKNFFAKMQGGASAKGAARASAREESESSGVTGAGDHAGGIFSNETLVAAAGDGSGGTGSGANSDSQGGFVGAQDTLLDTAHSVETADYGVAGGVADVGLKALDEGNAAKLEADSTYWTSSLRLAMQCAAAHPGADIFVQMLTVVDAEGNMLPTLGRGARLRKGAEGAVQAFPLKRSDVTAQADQHDEALMHELAQAPVMMLSLSPILDESGTPADLIRRAQQAEYVHLLAQFDRAAVSAQTPAILKASEELHTVWNEICTNPMLLDRLSMHGEAMQRELVALRTEPSESLSTHSTQQYLARVNWTRANEQVTRWVMERADIALERIRRVNTLLGEGLAPWNKPKQAASVGAKYGEFRPVDTVSGIPPRYYLRCDQIAQAMKDLLAWYGASVQRKRSPVLVAAQMYQRLVSIHPFPDANGRTARLIMDWILQMNGWPPALVANNNLALFPNEPNTFAPGQAELAVIEGLRKSVNVHMEALRIDD